MNSEHQTYMDFFGDSPEADIERFNKFDKPAEIAAMDALRRSFQVKLSEVEREEMLNSTWNQ